MEINFNNPDFDGILQNAGFTRKEEGSTIFTNGDVTIDLAKGMNTVNLRKIVYGTIGRQNKRRIG